MVKLTFLLAASLLPTLLSAQSLEPDEYHYTYDAANNLTSRKTVTGGMETTETLPVDPSGRNRPASFGEVPLAWDANGNLMQKGNLHLAFDYRNRLQEVRNSGGDLLASYTYDAGNRRVLQQIGTNVVETVWNGWQPIETRVNGALFSRRVYGRSLDEIVTLARDLDLDGNLETEYHALYDSSGNLALVTGEDGRPIERYSYDPYGRQKIYVDVTRPEIDQVLVADGAIWVEISETVDASAVADGATAGTIRLEEPSTATTFELTAEAPFLHRKRHRLSFRPDPLPSVGAELTLTFEPETLTDYFLNRPTAPIEVSFTWPENPGVVFDRAPPQVVEVRYTEAALEVEFSQLIDPVSAGPHIELSGGTTSWAVASLEDPYRLVSEAPVPAGTYDLVVGADLPNMAGRTMAVPFALSLTVAPESAPRIAYREQDPREVGTSTIGNTFGFHGLERDPVTGFVYMRNRYYDPELGRFISADPLGYIDGPSMYAAFGNDPINKHDPLGLACPECRLTPAQQSALMRAQDAMTPEQRREGYSSLVGAIPGVGDVKDWQEALSGYDLVAKQRVGWFNRSVTVGAAFIPILSGKNARDITSEIGHGISNAWRRMWGMPTPGGPTLPPRTNYAHYGMESLDDGLRMREQPLPSDSSPKLLPPRAPTVSTSLSDVSQSVFKTGDLPDNFITKAEAKSLGWNPQKGNLADVAPGKSIGGDVFGNREGLLPAAPGRTWYEADLNYSSGFRGSERLVYSSDGLIYYSSDHYKTFEQIGAR